LFNVFLLKLLIRADWLAYWAGHDGFVRYTKSTFRGPAFEGDVTFFDGEVVEKNLDTPWGVPLVTIKLKLTNQEGGTVVDATGQVELPLG
jgi:acyl dehydratase